MASKEGIRDPLSSTSHAFSQDGREPDHGGQQSTMWRLVAREPHFHFVSSLFSTYLEVTRFASDSSASLSARLPTWPSAFQARSAKRRESESGLRTRRAPQQRSSLCASLRFSSAAPMRCPLQVYWEVQKGRVARGAPAKVRSASAAPRVLRQSNRLRCPASAASAFSFGGPAALRTGDLPSPFPGDLCPRLLRQPHLRRKRRGPRARQPDPEAEAGAEARRRGGGAHKNKNTKTIRHVMSERSPIAPGSSLHENFPVPVGAS